MFLCRNGIERILPNGTKYTYTRWVIFGVPTNGVRENVYQVPVNGSPQVSLRVRVVLPLLVKRLPEYSVLRLRWMGTLGMLTEEIVFVPSVAARVTFVFHCTDEEKVNTVMNFPLSPT